VQAQKPRSTTFKSLLGERGEQGRGSVLFQIEGERAKERKFHIAAIMIQKPIEAPSVGKFQAKGEGKGGGKLVAGEEVRTPGTRLDSGKQRSNLHPRE